MNARNRIHLALCIVTLTGCQSRVDLISSAEAQPSQGPTHPYALPLENISPGTSVKAMAISLDADTNADFLEWQGDGDGVTGDADLWPVAHGTRITFKLLDAAEVTCCYLGDPDEATTTAIGAQSANTTRFVVEGGDEGGCWQLDGEGDTWTEVVNYTVLRDHGLMPAGVCATESANNDTTRFDVYGVCAVDADCDNVGGHPASTTCDTDRTVINYTTNDLPGVYIACRSTAAADLAYWVTR